jgi:spore germination protein YaaH
MTFLMLFSLIGFSADAQEPLGEHQLQKQEFGHKEKMVSHFDLSGKGIIPLQINRQKELSKMVFGFMPDWEYTGGANSDMHYELLTHVAAFDFLASPDGSIGYPSSWPWTDVINAAHAKGTKVIMAVTNFGGSTGAADVAHTIITNSSSKNNLFNNIKRIITTYQLDGVNIDFEAMDKADRGSLLNQFMADLTAFVHSELPGKEVSFDGPAVNWGGWNLDGLAQSLDYIFIMTYDYHGSWSDNTGAVSPLTNPNGGTCVQKSIHSDYSVPLAKYPQKLILGVPYYGKHWKTTTGAAGSAVSSYIGSTLYRNAVTDAESHGGFIWDNDSQTPWYRWQSGGWNQVWNDNEKSLGMKYDFALTENLGGVGIWALNYDGTRTELWSLINKKFAGAVTPIPSKPKSVAVLSKNDSTVTLKYRPGNYAESFRIYQSTDHKHYTLVKETADTLADISRLSADSVYYFKIASLNDAGESNKTDVLAAVPHKHHPKFLIVDGVHRRSFDAITQYEYPMMHLGYAFSSASNNAVIDGVVDLKDYQFIIWMLLDESTADDTFNKTEQARVKAYIDNNQGVFIVSGSEVGWDLVEKGDATDKSFYETYFKAEYVSDAPGASKTYYSVEDNNQAVYHFDDGTHGITNIGYPDLIKPKNGSVKSFTYVIPGSEVEYVAGVSYKTATGGMEYLAFPIEAVYNDQERKQLLQYVFGHFSEWLSVKPVHVQTGIKLYPNPTRGLVRISNPNHFKIARLAVFDVFGKKVRVSYNAQQIDLQQAAAGIYVVKIADQKGNQESFKLIKQ